MLHRKKDRKVKGGIAETLNYQGNVAISQDGPCFASSGITMNPILISKTAAPSKTSNRLAVGLAVIATAAFALATSSCATTKGFGQDVQKVGGKIEHEARKTGGAN